MGEHLLVEFYYDIKLSDGSHQKINILGQLYTKESEAEDALKEFITEQVKAINEHSKKVDEQLVKNNKALEVFNKLLGKTN